MKRLLLSAIIVAAFVLLAHQPTSAMAEFCPAMLKYQAVGQPENSPVPSALYGFELTALGPRTITSATLAFDTSAGWYTLELPPVVLSEKDRHYTSPYSSFTRHDYVSPVMYLRFPQTVTVAHAWVYAASAQNDALFGWQSRGVVQCTPPGAPSEKQRQPTKPVRHLQAPRANDQDSLNAPPQQASLLFAPSTSKSLEDAHCAEPFREVTVTTQAAAGFPRLVMQQGFTGQAMSQVAVAINGDGSILDAWTIGPSGYDAFDRSALRAARMSKFMGARAYCEPVPGRYFFLVLFSS